MDAETTKDYIKTVSAGFQAMADRFEAINAGCQIATDATDGGIDRERLLELVQADKEGRLIVLPCKVGDTVYFPLLGKIIEKSVFSIVSFANSERIYCGGTSEYFRLKDFGKTVFLTREEAEAALGGDAV